MSSRSQYPTAAPQDTVDTVDGRQIPDPYRWLEDVSAAATQTWSAEQDQLFTSWRDQLAAQAANTPFATARLAERMGELLDAGFISAPVWRGQRMFVSQRVGDQEHPVVMVHDDDGERVLIDPMRIDPTGGTTLDSWQPSKEGNLVAFQVSVGGTEESVLQIMEVATGKLVEEPIDRARYSPIAWLPGEEAFYYVRRLHPDLVPADQSQYHRRVWLHRLGADPASDVEIFGADQPMTSYFGVQVSRDGRWLIVSASAGTAPRSDVWIADLEASSLQAPTFTDVIVGQDSQTSAWVGRDGRLFLHTDHQAPRGRLAWAEPTSPTLWHSLLAEDPTAVLEDVALVDDGDPTAPTAIVAAWRRHAVSEVTTHDPRTGARTGTVELPGLGSANGLVTRPGGGPEVWLSYTDYVTSPTIYRWTSAEGLEVWTQPPGRRAQLPQIHVQQISTVSADGTTVRAFVIAPAAQVNAGAPTRPAPAVLYGYGGFQIGLDPGYSASILTWVEAGGVYVVANLRGGGEEGEQWHRDGMRENKQNVFDDFHAIAEEIIAQGWTTPTQLGIWGGSNGGLLVGAAVTQRPDLFAAAICSAPLLDMARYQRFGLGQTWTEEYGDAAVPTELDWLLSYSPYHRVQDGTAYPATLFTVFQGDTRVDPLHARKMAAAMQHSTTASPEQAPVLIRQESGVGHGGRALSRSISLLVDQWQFVAAWTGALEQSGGDR